MKLIPFFEEREREIKSNTEHYKDMSWTRLKNHSLIVAIMVVVMFHGDNGFAKVDCQKRGKHLIRL